MGKSEGKGSVQLRVWLFPCGKLERLEVLVSASGHPRGECGGKHGSAEEER